MATAELQELLKLGLTEGEAKVYLALLELGSSTVGPVVRTANVAYSNVYDILQRLIEKGLVSYIVKSKTRYFQASSPVNLSEYLERKEQEITKQKAALQRALPLFQKLQELKPQQEAEIFMGTNGLRTAYEHLLAKTTKSDEELFFYIHQPAYAAEADRFYASITPLLRSIPSRGISNPQYRKSPFNKQATFIKMRYVDFPIPGNIEICRDKVLMVSWEKPLIAVLITSSSIANHFRNYFESVWEQATK